MPNPTRAPRWVDAILTGQLGLQPAYGVGGRFPASDGLAEQSKFRSAMCAGRGVRESVTLPCATVVSLTAMASFTS